MVLPWLIAGGKMLADEIQSNENRSSIRSAMNKQIGGVDTAIGLQNKYYQPWQESGESALNKYTGLTTGEGYKESPLLKFQNRLLNHKLASRGASYGPSEYSTGYGNLLVQDYENQMKNLLPLMQYGYSASGNLANNVGNLEMTKGNIKASGILGKTPQVGNNISSALGTLNTLYGGGNVRIGNGETPLNNFVESSKENIPVNYGNYQDMFNNYNTNFSNIGAKPQQGNLYRKY